jgi:hypothetical protein
LSSQVSFWFTELGPSAITRTPNFSITGHKAQKRYRLSKGRQTRLKSTNIKKNIHLVVGLNLGPLIEAQKQERRANNTETR